MAKDNHVKDLETYLWLHSKGFKINTSAIVGDFNKVNGCKLTVTHESIEPIVRQYPNDINVRNNVYQTLSKIKEYYSADERFI